MDQKEPQFNGNVQGASYIACCSKETSQDIQLTPENAIRGESKQISSMQINVSCGEAENISAKKLDDNGTPPNKEPSEPVVEFAAVSTQLKENQNPDYGSSHDIDLSKTPQKKQRRRRNHRPKVTIEGKRKRTRRPATPKPVQAKETPIDVSSRGRENASAHLGKETGIVEQQTDVGLARDLNISMKKASNNSSQAPSTSPSKENPPAKRKYVRRKKLRETSAPTIEVTGELSKEMMTESSKTSSGRTLDIGIGARDESSSAIENATVGSSAGRENLNEHISMDNNSGKQVLDSYMSSPEDTQAPSTSPARRNPSVAKQEERATRKKKKYVRRKVLSKSSTPTEMTADLIEPTMPESTEIEQRSSLYFDAGARDESSTCRQNLNVHNIKESSVVAEAMHAGLICDQSTSVKQTLYNVLSLPEDTQAPSTSSQSKSPGAKLDANPVENRNRRNNLAIAQDGHENSTKLLLKSVRQSNQNDPNISNSQISMIRLQMLGSKRKHSGTTGCADMSSMNKIGAYHNGFPSYQNMFRIQFPNLQKRRRSEKGRSSNASITSSVTPVKEAEPTFHQEVAQAHPYASSSSYWNFGFEYNAARVPTISEATGSIIDDAQAFEEFKLSLRRAQICDCESLTRIRNFETDPNYFAHQLCISDRQTFGDAERPQTSIDALVAKTSASLTKNHNKNKSVVFSSSYSTINEMQQCQKFALGNYHQSSGKSIGASYIACCSKETSQDTQLTPENAIRGESKQIASTQIHGTCGEEENVSAKKLDDNGTPPNKEPSEPVVEFAAVSTQLKENQNPDYGSSHDIDLSKTPQQKPRRRRNHRPKVTIEGKRKRTRRPATPKPVQAKETPIDVSSRGRENASAHLGKETGIVEQQTDVGLARDLNISMKKASNNSSQAPSTSPSKENPPAKRKYVRRKKLRETSAPTIEVTGELSKEMMTESSKTSSGRTLDIGIGARDESSSAIENATVGSSAGRENLNEHISMDNNSGKQVLDSYMSSPEDTQAPSTSPARHNPSVAKQEERATSKKKKYVRRKVLSKSSTPTEMTADLIEPTMPESTEIEQRRSLYFDAGARDESSTCRQNLNVHNIKESSMVAEAMHAGLICDQSTSMKQTLYNVLSLPEDTLAPSTSSQSKSPGAKLAANSVENRNRRNNLAIAQDGQENSTKLLLKSMRQSDQNDPNISNSQISMIRLQMLGSKRKHSGTTRCADTSSMNEIGAYHNGFPSYQNMFRVQFPNLQKRRKSEKWKSSNASITSSVTTVKEAEPKFPQEVAQVHPYVAEVSASLKKKKHNKNKSVVFNSSYSTINEMQQCQNFALGNYHQSSGKSLAMKRSFPLKKQVDVSSYDSNSSNGPHATNPLIQAGAEKNSSSADGSVPGTTLAKPAEHPTAKRKYVRRKSLSKSNPPEAKAKENAIGKRKYVRRKRLNDFSTSATHPIETELAIPDSTKMAWRSSAGRENLNEHISKDNNDGLNSQFHGDLQAGAEKNSSSADGSVPGTILANIASGNGKTCVQIASDNDSSWSNLGSFYELLFRADKIWANFSQILPDNNDELKSQFHDGLQETTNIACCSKQTCQDILPTPNNAIRAESEQIASVRINIEEKHPRGEEENVPDKMLDNIGTPQNLELCDPIVEFAAISTPLKENHNPDNRSSHDIDLNESQQQKLRRNLISASQKPAQSKETPCLDHDLNTSMMD